MRGAVRGAAPWARGVRDAALDLDLLHEGALTVVQTNRAVTSVEDDLAVHLVECSAFLPQKILSSLTH